MRDHDQPKPAETQAAQDEPKPTPGDPDSPGQPLSHPSRVTKLNPKGLIKPPHAPRHLLFRRRPLESTEVLATRMLRETERATKEQGR